MFLALIRNLSPVIFEEDPKAAELANSSGANSARRRERHDGPATRSSGRRPTGAQGFVRQAVATLLNRGNYAAIVLDRRLSPASREELGQFLDEHLGHPAPCHCRARHRTAQQTPIRMVRQFSTDSANSIPAGWSTELRRVARNRAGAERRDPTAVPSLICGRA